MKWSWALGAPALGSVALSKGLDCHGRAAQKLPGQCSLQNTRMRMERLGDGRTCKRRRGVLGRVDTHARRNNALSDCLDLRITTMATHVGHFWDTISCRAGHHVPHTNGE